MAFEASDGKKFTNRPPMKQHEKSLMAKGGGSPDPLAQPAGGEQEMGGEDGSQVAAEHGPAHEIHMQHSPEGSHHVHSMHPDGHEHHSEHGSVDEAHEHAKKLAGGGMEQQNEPDGDEAEYE